MPASIEIRVHVSGPSRGSDDARYRREAQALVQFEGTNRINVLERSNQRADAGSDLSSSFFFLHSNNNQDASLGTSDSLGPTQRTEAIRDLFNSRLQSETPKASPVRYAALRTPAAAKLASPVLPWTSIKETPHLLVKGTPFPPRPQTAPGTPSKARKVLIRSQSDSWETPPSVIPDSQEANPSTQLDLLLSPHLKRQLPLSSPSRDLDPSPTRKRVRQRSSSPDATPSTQSQIEKLQSQEIGQVVAGPPQDGGKVQIEMTQDSKHQKIIRPRQGPAVGNYKFETHLTPRLLELSNRPSLRALNILCPTTRPVGRMERGYWRVDIAPWNEESKIKLWETLEDFIFRGKAGWGVWCCWGIDSRSELVHTEKFKEKEHGDMLKLWCFGQVIREIFLILFIGGVNNKKNPGTRPEWIDSNGDVVATAKGKYLG